MNRTKSQKGQALVIIALAIVGLVGFAALAIDGGRVFSDRRHAQSTADTAALSAALAKIKKKNITTAAQNIAAQNGYVDSSPDQDVTVHSPPISGPYAGNAEYIQVIIRSTIPTTFARVIGRSTVTSVVEAVARASTSTSGTSGGYGITALKQSGDALTFTGSGDVTIQGGIGDNAGFRSTGSGTYTVNGNVQVSGPLNYSGSINWNINGNVWANGYDASGSGDWNVTGSFFSNQNFRMTGSGNLSAGSLTVVGTYSETGSGVVTPWPPLSGAAQTAPVITDPFASILNPPANPGSCVAANFAGSTPHTINPGCYTSISNVGSGSLTFNPGEYYVTGNISTSGNGDVTANGVMLYLQSGSFSMNGSGNLNISPPTSGPYKGLTIYMDRGNTNAYSMRGSGASNFSGTIYAPSSAVTLIGSGGTFVVDSQIICSTSNITGSGGLNLAYNPANNYNPSDPGIELSQ
jgi:hypothetical protein